MCCACVDAEDVSITVNLCAQRVEDCFLLPARIREMEFVLFVFLHRQLPRKFLRFRLLKLLPSELWMRTMTLKTKSAQLKMNHHQPPAPVFMPRRGEWRNEWIAWCWRFKKVWKHKAECSQRLLNLQRYFTSSFIEISIVYIIIIQSLRSDVAAVASRHSANTEQQKSIDDDEKVCDLHFVLNTYYVIYLILFNMFEVWGCCCNS